MFRWNIVPNLGTDDSEPIMTFLASHMYPGVVLVFWVPSRILSLPFTKVNHDYQVHSMHLEQVSEVLCSWESEWGTRASPC